MPRHSLSDEQWARIEPLLPPEKPVIGRPSISHRRFFNAILWLVRTGAPWRDLPAEHGPWRTIATRFYRWRRNGTLFKVFKALQAQADGRGLLDWEMHCVDSTVIRAHQHVHCWLVQTDHEKREGWIASLDRIGALKPRTLVAGHKDPGAHDDGPEAILAATKSYIRDFDRFVPESRTPEELIDKMMQIHGERGNPYTLWTAAFGVSKQLAS
jgi:transposase